MKRTGHEVKAQLTRTIGTLVLGSDLQTLSWGDRHPALRLANWEEHGL